MPELPDVQVYCECLHRFYAESVLERVDLRSPFLVRTFQPDLAAAEGRKVLQFTRLGKQMVWQLEGDLHLVIHLMIAGRLHRRSAGSRPKSKTDLAAFHFQRADGSRDALMLTEAGAKRRASLHVVQGRDGLAALDRGGLELEQCTLSEFSERLLNENHTLKRSLTDPRLLSGIGNAYSDEILHAARLSPVKWTRRLSSAEVEQLHAAARSTLKLWTERIREQAGDGFLEKATAFRPEMAVHGRFGRPCPACGASVQRIRYADNETNYCPRCQTDGKILADRSLSRLLKQDWPRTIEELEG